MAQPLSHITLPLDPLFDLLGVSGFDVSPATRVKAWRVLESVGLETALKNPVGLKLLLAPVFARNPEDQIRFYEIFEKYVENLDLPDDSIVPIPSDNSDKFKKAIVPFGIIVLFLAVIGAMILESRKPQIIENPCFISFPQLRIPDRIPLDSTVTFLLVNAPNGRYLYRWEISRESKLLNSVEGTRMQHTFKNTGIYLVNLNVIDTAHIKKCEKDTTVSIQVYQNLPQKPNNINISLIGAALILIGALYWLYLHLTRYSFKRSLSTRVNTQKVSVPVPPAALTRSRSTRVNIQTLRKSKKGTNGDTPPLPFSFPREEWDDSDHERANSIK